MFNIVITNNFEYNNVCNYTRFMGICSYVHSTCLHNTHNVLPEVVPYCIQVTHII